MDSKITVSRLYNFLKQALSEHFPDANENQIVSRRIVNFLTGCDVSDIVTNPDKIVNPCADVNEIVDRVKKSEPLEYIFNSAQFLDLELFTEHSVLIPRPETEELALMILNDLKQRDVKPKLLDIGTGSGCIPIYLSTKFKNCDYYACDISEKAIATSRKNAEKYGSDINIFYCDILNYQDNTILNSLENFDIIVSNPPYVLDSEKKLMKQNVLDYEPHTALFVRDNDPLIFYRKITEFAAKKLNNGGKLYFEINEKFGKETLDLLREFGFKNCNICKDLFGKDRMSVAEK